MADIVSKAKRSDMMAGIRSSNTKPELRVRSHLHSKGFRYRRRTRIFSIIPDIVLKKYKIAVFVHGCFWHRHNECKLASNPKRNIDFWNKKFSANILRDKNNCDLLLKNGWKIIIFWECSIRDYSYKNADILKLLGAKNYVEIPPKN